MYEYSSKPLTRQDTGDIHGPKSENLTIYRLKALTVLWRIMVLEQRNSSPNLRMVVLILAIWPANPKALLEVMRYHQLFFAAGNEICKVRI